MAFILYSLLIAIAVFGYTALHGFGRSNGFFPLLESAVANGVHAHPFTANKEVDDVANFFLAFFWPTVDGNHPGLSLACFVFAGQWVAGWTLVTLEGYRAGNRGRLISL
jgi:hypothetical protein